MKIDTPLSLKADIAQLMNRIAVLEVEIEEASKKRLFAEVEQKRRELHVLEYKLQVKKSQLHPTHAKPAFDYGIEILM